MTAQSRGKESFIEESPDCIQLAAPIPPGTHSERSGCGNLKVCSQAEVNAMIRATSGGINIRTTLLFVALGGLFGYAAAIPAAADAAVAGTPESAGGNVADIQEPIPDPRKEIICERESRFPSRIITQRCYVKYHSEDGPEWVDDGLVSLLTREEMERLSVMQEQYEEQQKEIQQRQEMLCQEFGRC
jgi:hypothetical protein